MPKIREQLNSHTQYAHITSEFVLNWRFLNKKCKFIGVSCFFQVHTIVYTFLFITANKMQRYELTKGPLFHYLSFSSFLQNSQPLPHLFSPFEKLQHQEGEKNSKAHIRLKKKKPQ